MRPVGCVQFCGSVPSLPAHSGLPRPAPCTPSAAIPRLLSAHRLPRRAPIRGSWLSPPRPGPLRRAPPGSRLLRPPSAPWTCPGGLPCASCSLGPCIVPWGHVPRIARPCCVPMCRAPSVGPPDAPPAASGPSPSAGLLARLCAVLRPSFGHLSRPPARSPGRPSGGPLRYRHWVGRDAGTLTPPRHTMRRERIRFSTPSGFRRRSLRSISSRNQYEYGHATEYAVAPYTPRRSRHVRVLCILCGSCPTAVRLRRAFRSVSASE